jgi:hypothetical protein
MTGSIPVEIDYAPVIVDQSGDDLRIVGSSKMFYVNVTGTTPLTYFWYHDGDLVYSGPSNTYTITGITLEDAGEYWCNVENNCGIAESDIINFTVLDVQPVNVPAGWSGISTYLNIWDDEVEKIFQYITGELILVNDFEHVYWPGQNINTYEDGLWDTYTGAQIKLSNAATVNFEGLHIESKVVELTSTWTYLPILHPTAVPADEVFMQNPGTIYFAKDIAGTGVFWPEFGINTMGMLNPGLAYLVMITDPTSIDFGIFTKSFEIPENPGRSVNLSPWPDPTHTNVSHTIALPENIADVVMIPGDWIGIFNTDGLCCGLMEYRGTSNAISAFGNDITTYETDGMLDGEWMTFKAYRPATGEYFDLIPEFDLIAGSPGYFINNGLSVIGQLKAEATGITNSGESNLKVYPNPTTGVLYIEGIIEGSKIEISDAGGHIVFHTEAIGNQTIDLGQQASGLYTIRITNNEFTTIRKVMVE